MSEHETQTDVPFDETELSENVQQPVPPSGIVKRIGCGFLIVLWFVILLLPCFLIVLATQQEITISQGSLPGQQIRIWLIMESEQRGVGISTTSSIEIGEISCLQTNVNYILWQGKGDAASFCDCFSRFEDEWLLATTSQGACVTE
jgi:hypothetical protein